MKFTFYGHACFSVVSGGKTFLFDPFITPNGLTHGKVNLADIAADFILVSHGHADHVADLVALALQTGATVIGAYEVVGWAQKMGVQNVRPMNFGSVTLDFGKLHFVPAAHSSSLPDGSYGGNPGGFIVTTDEGTFYYSGDTGLTMDMRLVPHYGKPKFAILPVGGNFTMDAEDALEAAKMVGCDRVIGVHFDSFGLIKIDHAAAKKVFADAGKELVLLEIGESVTI